MKKMWLKINKKVFWVSLAVSIILAVVNSFQLSGAIAQIINTINGANNFQSFFESGSYSEQVSETSVGVLIFLFEALIITVIYSFWGLYIEMSSNIVTIGERNQNYNIGTRILDNKSSNDFWRCDCMQANPIDMLYCGRCGKPKYKEETQAVSKNNSNTSKSNISKPQGGGLWVCDCKHINAGSAMFCEKCGKPNKYLSESPTAAANICSKCGEQIPAGAKFCGKCGQRLN